MVYWISFYIIKAISKIFWPCTFYGVENFPSQGGFIIASNHISNLDPFILGLSQTRKFNYFAKEELFRN